MALKNIKKINQIKFHHIELFFFEVDVKTIKIFMKKEYKNTDLKFIRNNPPKNKFKKTKGIR